MKKIPPTHKDKKENKDKRDKKNQNEQNPVILEPHQKDHVDRIWKAISEDNNFAYEDVSKTGLGKTHSTYAIGWKLHHTYKMKIGIVASNKQALYSSDSWNSWAQKYEVKVEFMLTYAEIRQHNGKANKNWVYYDPVHMTYSATTKFETLASQGLFLIFDEYHRSTRKSETHKACSALVRSCYRQRHRCRIALLSFTPGDMPEHYPQILKMLGIIRHKKISLYDRSTKTHTLDGYGFSELVAYCKAINPTFTADTYLPDHITAKKLLHITKEIYDDVIKDRITFAMPNTEQKETITMTNLFLETEPEDLEIINKGIELLSSSVRWRNDNIGNGGNDGGNDGDNDGEWDMGGVFVGLRVIELGKLNLYARYVKQAAIRTPNKKFILSVGARSNENQYKLQQLLGKRYIPDGVYLALRLALRDNPMWQRNIDQNVFRIICKYYVECMDPIKPVVMNGKTPHNERNKIIDRFQSATNDIWCLIISPGVGSESISLHDKHGNHPREIIITPDHFHSRLVQSAGRINRVGVKSSCTISMIYSKEANVETSILDSMAKKSKVAKDLLSKDQQNEKFPADYNYFIEGDRDVELEQVLNRMRL